MNINYLIILFIIFFLIFYYLNISKIKTEFEKKNYNIIKNNFKNSQELIFKLFQIRKILYLKILVSNNNIKSEDDYDIYFYIEILRCVELILTKIQNFYKENNFEYIVNIVSNMINNILSKNSIVLDSTNKDIFLISCDNEYIYD
jgi:hypothetical protein